MILDLTVLLILLFCAGYYAKTGLIRAVLSLGGWIIGIGLGLYLCGPIRDFLCANTNLDDSLNAFLVEQMSGKAEDSLIWKSIPDLLHPAAEQAEETAVNAIANSFTNLLFLILGFLLVALAVKIVITLISLALKKDKEKGGPVGLMDGVLGLVLGMVIGVLVVLLLFALLVLLWNVLPEGAQVFLQESLDESILSGKLYAQNPLLSWMQSLAG